MCVNYIFMNVLFIFSNNQMWKNLKFFKWFQLRSNAIGLSCVHEGILVSFIIKLSFPSKETMISIWYWYNFIISYLLLLNQNIVFRYSWHLLRSVTLIIFLLDVLRPSCQGILLAHSRVFMCFLYNWINPYQSNLLFANTIDKIYTIKNSYLRFPQRLHNLKVKSKITSHKSPKMPKSYVFVVIGFMVTYRSKLISIEIIFSSNFSLINPFSSYFSRSLWKNLGNLVVLVCCVAKTDTFRSQIFVLILKKVV